MVPNAVVSLDHFGDARTRPQIGREPVRLRPLEQSLPETRFLARGQEAGPTWMGRAVKPPITLASVGLPPSPHTTGVSADSIRDLGAEEAPLQHFDRPPPPPLQLCCTAVGSHESMHRHLPYPCINYTWISNAMPTEVGNKVFAHLLLFGGHQWWKGMQGLYRPLLTAKINSQIQGGTLPDAAATNVVHRVCSGIIEDKKRCA